jgi:hypothetical protein
MSQGMSAQQAVKKAAAILGNVPKLESKYNPRKRSKSSKRTRASRGKLRLSALTSSALSTRARVFGKRFRKKRRKNLPFTNRQYKYLKYILRTNMSDPIKEKHIASTQWSANENQCSYHTLTVNNRDTMRTILNDAIRTQQAGGETIHDYSVLTTNNLKVRFKPTKMKIRIKNNSSFGCRLHVWTVKPKRLGDSTVLSKMTDFFDDQSGDSTTSYETELTYWPKHASQFRMHYQMFKHKAYELPPGAECMVVRYGPSFTWNEDYENDHSKQYAPYRTRHFLFRLEGVVSHDNASTSTVGVGQATVDVVYEQHWTFTVTDHTRVTNYYLSNTLPAMANDTQFQVRNAEEVTHTL